MKQLNLKSILNSNEVAGKIIRDVASLEWELELLITRYFTAQERFNEFMDLIVSSFNFGQKVSILRKMNLPTKMISQPNAVKSLEKFQKIRNIIAHSDYISDSEILKISSDNELMKMFRDYPKSFNAEVRNTKNRINRLMHSYKVRKRKLKVTKD